MRWLIGLSLLCTGVMAASAEAVLSGQDIFQTRCNVCHKLPDTAQRSPTQWAMLVEVMQQTMANKGVTQLTDAEQQSLLMYLANQRSDGVADVPANPGRDTFVVRCALCHQLPEPTMLRPRQWQAIVVTMQQRMQQAGMPQLTPAETQLVLEHLASEAGE